MCFDKNRTENRQLGKQNRDFDLKMILGKVAISMSMLEIVTPLDVFARLICQCCVS